MEIPRSFINVLCLTRKVFNSNEFIRGIYSKVYKCGHLILLKIIRWKIIARKYISLSQEREIWKFDRESEHSIHSNPIHLFSAEKMLFIKEYSKRTYA